MARVCARTRLTAVDRGWHALTQLTQRHAHVPRRHRVRAVDLGVAASAQQRGVVAAKHDGRRRGAYVAVHRAVALRHGGGGNGRNCQAVPPAGGASVVGCALRCRYNVSIAQRTPPGPLAAATMKVSVKLSSGDKHDLQVEASETVAALKQRLAAVANLPEEQQRLVYKVRASFWLSRPACECSPACAVHAGAVRRGACFRTRRLLASTAWRRATSCTPCVAGATPARSASASLLTARRPFVRVRGTSGATLDTALTLRAREQRCNAAAQRGASACRARRGPSGLRWRRSRRRGCVALPQRKVHTVV